MTDTLARIRQAAGLFLSWVVIICSGASGRASEGGQDCQAPPPRDLVKNEATTAPTSPQTRRILRISADPNNLPFTNRELEGFENKIATLVARELDADLEYIWRAQRRGFFRSAFKEGECDIVLGVPAGFERALTTRPYYRSSYVFVTRSDRKIGIRSLDDDALPHLKIGVQLIGDDGFNTPPAHALAARHLVDNLVGYTVYGDYGQANPPARIVDAVRTGAVDIGVAWGPMAGYFAHRDGGDLAIIPVEPELDRTGIPLAFSIAMGVRKGDAALLNQLNDVLDRRGAEIGRILDTYGIPRLPLKALNSADRESPDKSDVRSRSKP
jgi:mxaJ protein